MRLNLVKSLLKTLVLKIKLVALIDVLGKGLTLNNYPTKMLKVADDYFKNREFRSEVYAMAFSEGMEMFQKGLLKKDDHC